MSDNIVRNEMPYLGEKSKLGLIAFDCFRKRPKKAPAEDLHYIHYTSNDE